MPRTPVSLCQRSVPLSSLVLLTPFTLLPTMLEAHFSSSSLSDLEVLLHLLMPHGVVVRRELYLGACKVSHMSLNQLAETMATRTTSVVMTIVLSTLQLLPMANRTVKLL